VTQTRRPKLQDSVLREKDTDGLGILRFFDERKEGVEVLPNKSGVLVKEVRRDRPYALAGLRAGDVITAVDGVAVTSPESFRITLRARLAEGKRFLPLSIQRAGKTVELRVPRED
jgi:S1-C subfamily serine protease